MPREEGRLKQILRIRLHYVHLVRDGHRADRVGGSRLAYRRSWVLIIGQYGSLRILHGARGITFNLDVGDSFIVKIKITDCIAPTDIGVDLPFDHKSASLKASLRRVHCPNEAKPVAEGSTGAKNHIVDVLCAAHIIDISWVLENCVSG